MSPTIELAKKPLKVLIAEMQQQRLKDAAKESALSAAERDQQKRDAWFSKMKGSRASEMVLVGDGGITLADVCRWLGEALK